MAIITTNGSFGATAAVTSTTLNAVADAATFDDPVDGTSLELKSDGKLGIKDAGVTAAKLATDALELAYPVGSIYMNSSVATSPATLLGFGTWVALSAGRVLIGAGEGTDAQPTPETVTFTASSTGGEYNHTLTEDEMPVHNHVQQKFTRGYNVDYGSGWGIRPIADVGGNGTSYLTNNSGGGLVHNNLQPYLVVYMWTRTA